MLSTICENHRTAVSKIFVALALGLLVGVPNLTKAENEDAVTTSSTSTQSSITVNPSRKIPAKAIKTTMGPPSNGFVVLGSEGKIYRLSAAVQIHDVDNKLLLPVKIEKKVPVKVLFDSYGSVFRVWLLTPEEAAKRESTTNSNTTTNQ